MSFTQALSSIESSVIFKRFIKEHPESELVAGFFILDFLNNKNQKSLDYKSKDKIFTFSLSESDEITFKEDELMDNPNIPKLEKISRNIKIDIDEIPSLAENTALENNIKNNFQKIIAVLQIYNKQQIWNLTCILDGFIILNILIDSDTGDVVKFNRKSMTDIVRRV